MSQYDESKFDKEALDRALREAAEYFIPLERLQLQSKKIGKGGYGVVRLAELRFQDSDTKSPILVAVKDLQDDNRGALPCQVACRLLREISVWSSFQHKNILQFIGFHLSNDYQTALLVSSYAQYGNIRDYLLKSDITLVERLGWVRDTVCGLNYLHTRSPSFIHGDLKAANVLLNDNREAVLCDFGLTFSLKDGPTGLTTVPGFKGTVRWCSREVLEAEEDKPLTLESDIWSWGCLVLEIMTGDYPYQEIQNEHTIILHMTRDKRAPSQLDTPVTRMWPARLLSLVQECWNFEPKKRPIVTKCLDRLEEVLSVERFLNSALNRTECSGISWT